MHLKNGLILSILLLVFLLCSGCAATKDIGRGVARMGQGVGQDLSLAGSSIMQFDEWFREHCW